MDERRIDWGVIRTAGGDLGRLAGDLESLTQETEQLLAGFGEPWGSDDIGSLIGETCTICADKIFDLFDEVAAIMRTDAEDLGVMADNYQASQGKATATVQWAGDPLANI
ncbi:hypothetical protein [Actinopolymorpha pittospori]|uniref:Excreted virulence factor EspC, type VII ESX diderm n=1 Tax=Actinopolymorpha pittospori TaxID=648752 RepID=A0A927MWT3_9ACTN|nr:hypothetical protein [Actinopolymorpha pittospori]MBE1606208.1 hypothetical protein [Actinopolymorpha pittospori]